MALEDELLLDRKTEDEEDITPIMIRKQESTGVSCSSSSFSSGMQNGQEINNWKDPLYCNNAGGGKNTKGQIFVYMQILHISDIRTAEQDFRAKFYFRATWVQPKPILLMRTKDKTKKETSSVLKYFSTTPKFVNDEFWPCEYIYKPIIGFSNAIEEIDLCKQTLGVSKWRKPIPPSGDRSNDYVVMEWKGNGSGYFTHKFELENYPRDIQLLKITMESLDPDITIHNDNSNGVNSIIRKDYFVDHGFKFEPYKDLLAKEENSDPLNHCSQSLLASSDKYYTTDTSKREFTRLSYIIPSRRYNKQPVRDIAVPVCLISLSAMSSFVFPPEEISMRLTVSITIGLVMAAYSYQLSAFLPRMEDSNSFVTYVFHSFVIVFLTVITNTIVFLIECKGRRNCNAEDDDLMIFEAKYEDEMINSFERRPINDEGLPIFDYIIIVINMGAWLWRNLLFFYDLYCVYKDKEVERVQKELKKAEKNVIVENPPFEKDDYKGSNMSKSILSGKLLQTSDRYLKECR